VESIDLRIKKTMKVIYEAFIECCKQKTFSSITVSDICEAAMINRSTFYNHYSDKFDLRARITQDALCYFYDHMDLSCFQIEHSKLNLLKSPLKKELANIYKKKETYIQLWHPNLESNIYEQMTMLIEQKMRDHTEQFFYKDKKSGKFQGAYELFARLFAADAMTVIKWWFQVSPQIYSEQVADIIISNIKDGMYRSFIG